MIGENIRITEVVTMTNITSFNGFGRYFTHYEVYLFLVLMILWFYVLKEQKTFLTFEISFLNWFHYFFIFLRLFVHLIMK